MTQARTQAALLPLFSEGDPPIQISPSVGYLYVGSLGGVTGVGGDPPWPRFLRGSKGSCFGVFNLSLTWCCQIIFINFNIFLLFLAFGLIL